MQVKELIPHIKKSLSAHVRDITDIFGWGDTDEGKLPFSLGTFIVGIIGDVITWVKEKFAFAADAVIEGWTNLKTFIADGVLAVKNWIVEKFTFGKDAVIAGWDGLLNFITGIVGTIKTWFTDKFSFDKDTVIAG